MSTSSSLQPAAAIVTTIGQGAPPLPDLTPTPVPARRFRSNLSASSSSSSAAFISALSTDNPVYSPRTPTQVRIPRNTIIQNQNNSASRSDSGGGLFVDDGDDGDDNDDRTGRNISNDEPITPPSLKRRRIKMENGDDEYVAVHHVPSIQGNMNRGQQQNIPRNQQSISRYFSDTRGAARGTARENQEDLMGELDSEDERRLAELSDSSLTTTQIISQKEREENAALLPTLPAPVPATPSTPTPRQQRASIVGGLHTPVTERAPATGGKTGEPPGSAGEQLSSTQINADGDYEVTAKVMNLLAGQPIAESVRAAVRDTLNNYALRARGVERGREMTRVALQARNATISELESQIANLREEKNSYKARIRQLGSSLGALLEDGPDG